MQSRSPSGSLTSFLIRLCFARLLFQDTFRTAMRILRVIAARSFARRSSSFRSVLRPAALWSLVEEFVSEHLPADAAAPFAAPVWPDAALADIWESDARRTLPLQEDATTTATTTPQPSLSSHSWPSSSYVFLVPVVVRFTKIMCGKGLTTKKFAMQLMTFTCRMLCRNMAMIVTEPSGDSMTYLPFLSSLFSLLTLLTDLPTYRPTDLPTDLPTYRPTEVPTNLPTYRPTYRPTDRPTDLPTYRPTDQPTNLPT